jgi:hypothetical protein
MTVATAYLTLALCVGVPNPKPQPVVVVSPQESVTCPGLAGRYYGCHTNRPRRIVIGSGEEALGHELMHDLLMQRYHDADPNHVRPEWRACGANAITGAD